MAKRIMLQGTSSNVGKSLTAAALCRIFAQDGYNVAPFKSQNMGSNSYITRDGGEISRAQAVQAQAAGIEPSVLMNPVLLKPSSDVGADVIVLGKPMGAMSARDYHEYKPLLRGRIKRAFEQLSQGRDVIVIEGAGSPAEINLREYDIVNMGLAEMVDAPVLLIGDIDRGGVFASLLGTVMLMSESERARVKGLIINKFRGDVTLLKSGLDAIEELTGIPVLGVIPYIKVDIDDEDSLSERLMSRERGEVDVAVARLKHISNFTDFTALERLGAVRYVSDANLGEPDALLLPGTTNAWDDLDDLKASGMFDAIADYARRGGLVLGVCGGFELLGRELCGPGGMKQGLGLLDMRVAYSGEPGEPRQVEAIVSNEMFGVGNDEKLKCYEIPMGKFEYGSGCKPFISAMRGDSYYLCGVADENADVIGVNLHGIFDNGSFALGFVNSIRRKKGLEALSELASMEEHASEQYDLIAGHVREHLDIAAIWDIMESYGG